MGNLRTNVSGGGVLLKEIEKLEYLNNLLEMKYEDDYAASGSQRLDFQFPDKIPEFFQYVPELSDKKGFVCLKPCKIRYKVDQDGNATYINMKRSGSTTFYKTLWNVYSMSSYEFHLGDEAYFTTTSTAGTSKLVYQVIPL